MSKPDLTPEQQARQDLIDFVEPHLMEGDGDHIEEKRIKFARDYYSTYLRRAEYEVTGESFLLFNRVVFGKEYDMNDIDYPPTEDRLHFLKLEVDDGQVPHFLYGKSPRLHILSLGADKDYEEGVLWRRNPEQFASGLFVGRIIGGLEELKQGGRLQPVTPVS